MSTLSTDQLAQLSSDYKNLATGLLQYKLNNADKLSIIEFQDLSGRINLIVHNSNILAALATYETSQDISGSLDSLQDATTKIDDALAKIKKVQDIINMAAIVINIGTDFLSRDIKTAASDIGKFVKQVNTAVKTDA